jgi:hypothetical protein
MSVRESGSFDSETVTVLRSVLDDAWETLSPEHRAGTSKSVLAERILRLAAQGERDPTQLRARAVIGLVSSIPGHGARRLTSGRL